MVYTVDEPQKRYHITTLGSVWQMAESSFPKMEECRKGPVLSSEP